MTLIDVFIIVWVHLPHNQYHKGVISLQWQEHPFKRLKDVFFLKIQCMKHLSQETQCPFRMFTCKCLRKADKIGAYYNINERWYPLISNPSHQFYRRLGWQVNPLRKELSLNQKKQRGCYREAPVCSSRMPWDHHIKHLCNDFQ